MHQHYKRQNSLLFHSTTRLKILKAFLPLLTTKFISSYLAVYIMHYFFTWYFLLFQHNKVLFPPGTIKILPSFSDFFFCKPLNSFRWGDLFMSFSKKKNKNKTHTHTPKNLALHIQQCQQGLVKLKEKIDCSVFSCHKSRYTRSREVCTEGVLAVVDLGAVIKK